MIEWVPLPPELYLSAYEICKEGFILIAKTRRILNPTADPVSGYFRVSLRRNDSYTPTTFNVHYLIAATFLPLVDTNKYVLHLDGNGSNNHVDNLQRVAKKPQIRRSKRFLEPGEFRPQKKISMYEEYVKVVTKQNKEITDATNPTKDIPIPTNDICEVVENILNV